MSPSHKGRARKAIRERKSAHADTMNITVRRHILGVLSILALIAAAVVWFGYDGNQTKMLAAMCLRVGLGLGVIWLALPQIVTICERFPPRLMFAVLLGGMLALARPKTLPLVALIVAVVAALEFVGWMLTPLPKKKRSGSRQKRKR